MGVVASICTIIGVWLATAMSSQCVGQSGINPMEIFGIIVLIATKAVSSIGQTEAFFVAAIVAVACGLVGDVMNDFKAGYILKSDPKAQWLGEVIGGIIGAFVSVVVPSEIRICSRHHRQVLLRQWWEGSLIYRHLSSD